MKESSKQREEKLVPITERKLIFEKVASWCK